jgi:hypothetical protein
MSEALEKIRARHQHTHWCEMPLEPRQPCDVVRLAEALEDAREALASLGRAPLNRVLSNERIAAEQKAEHTLREVAGLDKPHCTQDDGTPWPTKYGCGGEKCGDCEP